MKNHEVREPAVLMTAAERMQIDASGITARDTLFHGLSVETRATGSTQNNGRPL